MDYLVSFTVHCADGKHTANSNRKNTPRIIAIGINVITLAIEAITLLSTRLLTGLLKLSTGAVVNRKVVSSDQHTWTVVKVVLTIAMQSPDQITRSHGSSEFRGCLCFSFHLYLTRVYQITCLV